MVIGFGIQILSGIWLTSIDFNVSLLTLCTNAFMQGLAVGLIWTPIATSAFWTLDPSLRADGVAVFHLMRNIGSSFFISISVAEVVRATGANYSRMTEFVTPYNRTLSLPTVMGSWTIDSLSGLAGLAREINQQAALIGYLNAFWMYTAVSAMAIPLVFMVRRPRGVVGWVERSADPTQAAIATCVGSSLTLDPTYAYLTRGPRTASWWP